MKKHKKEESNNNQILLALYATVDKRKQLLGPQHLNVAATLTKIGFEEEQTNDLEKAMEAHVEALFIYKEAFGIKENRRSRDISSSNYHHRQELTIIGNDEEEEFNYNFESYSQVCLLCDAYKNVGEIHHKWCQLDDAMEVFFHSMKILEIIVSQRQQARIVDGDSFQMMSSTTTDQRDSKLETRLAELLMKCGKIYYEMRRLDDGLKLLFRSKRLFSELSDDNNHNAHDASVSNSSTDSHSRESSKRSDRNFRNYAESLSWIGRIHVDKGEYEAALTMYREALRVKKHILSANDPSVASSLGNIGNVYFRMGIYDKAMTTYKEVLEMKETILGPNHPSVGLTLVSIGSIYEQRKDYDQAMELFHRALYIQKDHINGDPSSRVDDNVNLAATLNNIGNIHNRRGEHAYAMNAYSDSLELKERVLGRNHPLVALTLVCIGNVHEQKGNYEDAMDLYTEAKKIQTESLGSDNHIDLAATINNMGVVFGKMNKFEESMESYIKVLCIYKDNLGESHPDVALPLLNIGEIHRHWDEYDKAFSSLFEALRIQKACLGPNHVDIASTYVNIAVTYVESGDDDEQAIVFLKKALRIYRLAGMSDSDPTVKEVLQHLSKVDFSVGTQLQHALSWSGLMTSGNSSLRKLVSGITTVSSDLSDLLQCGGALRRDHLLRNDNGSSRNHIISCSYYSDDDSDIDETVLSNDDDETATSTVVKDAVEV